MSEPQNLVARCFFFCSRLIWANFFFLFLGIIGKFTCTSLLVPRTTCYFYVNDSLVPTSIPLAHETFTSTCNIILVFFINIILQFNLIHFIR